MNTNVERFSRMFVHIENDCWLWIGSKDWQGYGQFWYQEALTSYVQRAHRVSYKLFVGTLPDYLQIDHLCLNKSCVNPDHLEAVTLDENLSRSRVKIKTKIGAKI